MTKGHQPYLFYNKAVCLLKSRKYVEIWEHSIGILLFQSLLFMTTSSQPNFGTICYLKYLSACGVKYPVSLLWNYIRNLYLKCIISPHFIIFLLKWNNLFCHYFSPILATIKSPPAWILMAYQSIWISPFQICRNVFSLWVVRNKYLMQTLNYLIQWIWNMKYYFLNLLITDSTIPKYLILEIFQPYVSVVWRSHQLVTGLLGCPYSSME